MNFDQDTPLSRIKGETIKAHNALMDYFLMGGGRSFNKLFDRWERIQKSPEPYPKEPPTKRVQTLKDWSSRYHWQARIARQTEIDNAIALEQYRQQHMSEGEALAILAEQARGNMGHFADVRSQADLANHPKSALVKSIIQHYTQTTKGSGKAAKSEIKARITLSLYNAQEALKLILRHHGSFNDKIDIRSEVAVKAYMQISPDDWDDNLDEPTGD